MKNALIVAATAIAKVAPAQIPSTAIWTAVQTPVQLTNKWQWHNDAGYRTIGISQSAYQYLYRTGIRYFLNKNVSVATGAAWFFTRSSYLKTNQEFGKEFRLWQEVNLAIPIGNRFSIQNRFRPEERWFEAVHNKKAYYAFLFAWYIAGTKMFSNKWGVQLSNENMQQSVTGKFTLNQNRLMASSIYIPRHSVQWQAGYMWLLLPTASQAVLTLTFQKSFSLYGGKKYNSK